VGREELEGVCKEWVRRGREMGLIPLEEKGERVEEGKRENGGCELRGGGESISPIPFDLIPSPLSPSGLSISTDHLKVPPVPIPPPLSTSSSSTSVSSNSLPSASTSASSVEDGCLEEAVRRAKEEGRGDGTPVNREGNSNGTPTKLMQKIEISDEGVKNGFEGDGGELVEVN